VQKHVQAAGIICDETVAALSIPHFQGPGSHPISPFSAPTQPDDDGDGGGAGRASEGGGDGGRRPGVDFATSPAGGLGAVPACRFAAR
jgi:hypothetical protein